MKQIGLIAALIMVALVVTSCITWVDDEDDNSGNSQGGKLLSKLIEVGDWELSFYYQNGKLIKIDDDYGFYVNFTYSGKTVTIDLPNEKQILELNNDGFVESGLIIDGSNTWTFNCKYSNGYLTEISIPNIPSISRFPYPNRMEYKYDNNGNLLVISGYGKNNKIIGENKFTSSKNLTKGKPNFHLFGMEYGHLQEFPFWWAYFAGFWGKDTKNIVSKIELVFYAVNDYTGETFTVTDECIINYALYDDDYVKTMNFKYYYAGASYVTDGLSLAFTYE